MSICVHTRRPELDEVEVKLAASQERIRVLETLLTVDVHAENVAISDELELALKRERILREGLKEYGNPSNWYQREDFDTDGSSLGFTWEHYGNGPCVALDTITAAEKVKG